MTVKEQREIKKQENEGKKQAIDDIVERIEVAHLAILRMDRQSTQEKKRVGDMLVELREMVKNKPGRWTYFSYWVKRNLSINYRRVQRYISIAENWELIEANLGDDENLTFRLAAAIIASGKPTPKEPAEPDYTLVENRILAVAYDHDVDGDYENILKMLKELGFSEKTIVRAVTKSAWSRRPV